MRGRRLFADPPSPGELAELDRRRQEREQLEAEISRKKAELKELERHRDELIKEGKPLDNTPFDIYSGTPPTPKPPAQWRGSPWRGLPYSRRYREERAQQQEESNNVLDVERKEEEAIRTQRKMKWWRRMEQCVGCAQPAQLACSACRAEFYCSKECQESSKQCNC